MELLECHIHELQPLESDHAFVCNRYCKCESLRAMPRARAGSIHQKVGNSQSKREPKRTLEACRLRQPNVAPVH